jgi:hypothetical protein
MDSQTEPAHLVITQTLKGYHLENDAGWYDAIPLMEYAFSTSFQKAIACIPLDAYSALPRKPKLV